jgi:hypothetical protein
MKLQRQILRSTVILMAITSAFAAAVRPQGAAKAEAPARPDGKQAYEHIKFLAADSMKGRMSGTPEYRKAAEYVAAKFKEFGLQPRGDNGSWFQVRHK